MRPLYIVIGSEGLGVGEEDLGKLLMANFLKMLGGEKELPSAIFLMNRGVYLATRSNDAIDFLKHLEKQGVSILLCQTCVEYYGNGEELTVGDISRMGKLVDMVTSGRVAFI